MVNSYTVYIMILHNSYANHPRAGAEVNQSFVNCRLNGIDLLCTRGNESSVQECTVTPLPYTCPNAIITCIKGLLVL